MKKKREDTGTTEIKLCRSLAGYTLRDQIRSTVIGNELIISKYVINNNRIHNDKLNWTRHVEVVEPERISKQLMSYKPRGTISIRCPKFRCKDRGIEGQKLDDYNDNDAQSCLLRISAKTSH